MAISWWYRTPCQGHPAVSYRGEQGIPACWGPAGDTSHLGTAEHGLHYRTGSTIPSSSDQPCIIKNVCLKRYTLIKPTLVVYFSLQYNQTRIDVQEAWGGLNNKEGELLWEMFKNCFKIFLSFARLA